MRVPLAICLALILTTSASVACAQDAPRAETTPEAAEQDAPIYEAWWLWVSIALVAYGVTMAVVVDLTTDDPASSTAGLTVRF